MDQPANIHQMPGLPVLGNFHQIAGSQLHTLLEGWDREHGPFVRFRIFGREVLTISDLEIALEVFKRRPHSFRRTRNIERVIRELGAHGLFDAEGDDWRRQSRLVKGAFARKSIQASLDILDRVSQRLINAWKKRPDENFDVRVPLKCFTADVTTLLAFGYDLNTVERESDLQSQIQVLFDAIGRRLTAPFPYWRYLPIPKERAVTRAMQAIRPLVLDVIAQAKEGKSNRPTLLDGMLEAREREDFSDQDVYGNVLTLLLAGEDTTANGLAWALYYLALNPEWQTRLRDEANEVLGDRITPDKLSELAGLRACEAVFKEALRLRSPAPFVFFEPTEDVELGGVQFQQGKLLVALTRRMAMNEQNFSEPERFYPERWLVSDALGLSREAKRRFARIKARKRRTCRVHSSLSNAESSESREKNVTASVDRTLEPKREGWNHNLKAALAFGSGPRTCPGAQLAMVEAQILLAAICRNFELSFEGSNDDIEEIFSFVMHPRSMPLRIRPR